MHPLFLLAFATFAVVAGFGVWNYRSTRNLQNPDANKSGIGGPNDPMAGKTEGIRDAETMRQSMNAASARSR
jgi:hypothetical protein